MITLTVQMRIKSENPLPFTLGVSALGEGALLGEKIDETLKFDRRNLISLESEAMDRADIEQPSFGLFSSGGRIYFRDKNYLFLSFANSGILKGNEEIEVFLNNTISKTKKRVGKYFASDWFYDNNNNTIEISFSDGIEELQDIVVEKILYDFKRFDSLSGEDLSWFYKKLYEITPQKFGFKPFDELDSKTHERLKSVKVPYPFLENSSLWSAWDKLCQIGLLHIYKKNDLTICEYNEGN